MTLRDFILTMLDMRRIAASYALKGNSVMAMHVQSAARWNENRARAILRDLYGVVR
ncbi:MAG: hypothetical protein ACYC3L_00805 [Gemmatimonadaceae bacterium]